MKTLIMVTAIALIAVGCGTVRKGLNLVNNGIEAAVSVKDPVIGAANKLVDVAENLSTNAFKGASATATSATQ